MSFKFKVIGFTLGLVMLAMLASVAINAAEKLINRPFDILDREIKNISQSW